LLTYLWIISTIAHKAVVVISVQSILVHDLSETRILKSQGSTTYFSTLIPRLFISVLVNSKEEEICSIGIIISYKSSLSLFVLLIIIIVFVPSGSYIFNVKYDIYIINTSLLIIISFFPILLHCLIILRYYYCTKKLTYFYLENYSLIPSESFSPTEFK